MSTGYGLLLCSDTERCARRPARLLIFRSHRDSIDPIRGNSEIAFAIAFLDGQSRSLWSGETETIGDEEFRE